MSYYFHPESRVPIIGRRLRVAYEPPTYDDLLAEMGERGYLIAHYLTRNLHRRARWIQSQVGVNELTRRQASGEISFLVYYAMPWEETRMGLSTAVDPPHSQRVIPTPTVRTGGRESSQQLVEPFWLSCRVDTELNRVSVMPSGSNTAQSRPNDRSSRTNDLPAQERWRVVSRANNAQWLDVLVNWLNEPQSQE